LSERPDPDFLISYAGVNESWARWIAVEMERAGYRTASQVLVLRPSHDFVHEMHARMASAARTIAVLSPAYLDSKFGEAEWRTAFADDPDGELGKLIPITVQPCRPPGLLLRTVISVDLVDVGEPTARACRSRPVPSRLRWCSRRVDTADGFTDSCRSGSDLRRCRGSLAHVRVSSAARTGEGVPTPPPSPSSWPHFSSWCRGQGWRSHRGATP